ncbi:tripartite tricarboxylate transporter TctB family protein [Ruegeria sp. SCP11]|uniref:tripartite tricarboxylate transporter TctB family protein n=1 Tax=Ruegeria sp. SCP11 TaxID=3141378 RepID=UPI003335E761
MKINADRASGLFFLFFGLALYWFIIPTFVEQVEGGWVHPDTVPNAVAIVLSLCGALLILRPTKHHTQEASEFVRAGLYFGLLMVALVLLGRFGFVYIAPIIALVIMLLIGERRPFWLVCGVVGMPGAIWFLVVQVLDRALP